MRKTSDSLTLLKREIIPPSPVPKGKKCNAHIHPCSDPSKATHAEPAWHKETRVPARALQLLVVKDNPNAEVTPHESRCEPLAQPKGNLGHIDNVPALPKLVVVVNPRVALLQRPWQLPSHRRVL